MMETQDVVPGELRQLEKQWNYGMIAAAIIISFLGTFTSTQLMIQARLSTKFASVLTWVVIISLTFGFCAAWALHFVGMLACKLDLPISLNPGLTVFSALLAVIFTFSAIGSGILKERYNSGRARRARRMAPRKLRGKPHGVAQWPSVTAADEADQEETSLPLLSRDSTEDGQDEEQHPGLSLPHEQPLGRVREVTYPSEIATNGQHDEVADDSAPRPSESHDSSSNRNSSSGAPPIDDLKGMAFQRPHPGTNVFYATCIGVFGRITVKSIFMGLLWSLSLTSMHYAGMASLVIPDGFMKLEAPIVILSALISWVVCIVGYIYMVNIEPFLSQQILLSVIVALGIGTFHFTGMHATTFWSSRPPSDVTGYPPQLPVAVCSIAILTCMLANGLLAHNATVSRNKLAEVVLTRRFLWRAIAQKENAEAEAAARTSFIALASHEIRTPLHQLRGFTDLLSKTDLEPDSRKLLDSIQDATKTLSLITNNVLDWSKLESDRDAMCRLTPLDVRSVSESILVLLPSIDDDDHVELLVSISPNVPESILLDETYIHRILMNLLSNSLKFTRHGYVMLSLETAPEGLIIKVRDSGIGIPEAFLPQLFEPFSQAETRGSQRGTGLGLSIVKQLLQKMGGSITVESTFNGQGSTNPSETGSIFSITIPTQISPATSHTTRELLEPGNVAIFYDETGRGLEGLVLAWEIFGHKVTVIRQFTDLSSLQIKYVWVDSKYLLSHPECLQKLLSQDDWIVLVPYDDQEILKRLPGALLTQNFIPLQKPLVWHTFRSRIALAKSSPSSSALTLPFPTSVSQSKGRSSPSTNLISNHVNILLVEDNKINQKLANRMLTSMGYSVMLANDGEEAISQVLKHDMAIDMILMDQSMPIKDGITATREIRGLEQQGKLARRHFIIAITAVVDTDSRVQFKSAGADDFLAKPLSLVKLEQTLSTYLRVE